MRTKDAHEQPEQAHINEIATGRLPGDLDAQWGRSGAGAGDDWPGLVGAL